MLRRLGSIFAPPIFADDEDKTRKAKYANVIALVFLTAAVGYEAYVRGILRYAGSSLVDLALFSIAFICLLSLWLLRRGQVGAASLLIVSFIWAASNALAATGSGNRDSAYLVNFAIVLMAGLLMGWRASMVVIGFSILSGFALAFAEESGLIQVQVYPATSVAFDMAFLFLVFAAFLYQLIDGLEGALRRSRTNLVRLETAHASLSATQEELQNRSADLQRANEELEDRTRQLHGIALVTHTSASIKDFEALLASLTSAVSHRLGYYHVGLFLLDELGEYAILRSANTEAGRKLLAGGYRVPIGKIASIGFVVQTGKPQVIQSSLTAPRVVEHPDFPETRSELVLPLRAGDRVIGLLDIHSEQPAAFTDNDVSTLAILADQIAVTIQNLLLYEQAQNALQQVGITSLQASADAWKQYRKAMQTLGYRYDGVKSERLQAAKPAARGNNALSVPVQLRGQTIGAFKLNAGDPARAWTEDEMVMVRATAERVALALESARLLEEAQKRATRETFLSEVATKLSASFQLDSILRDTVQELGETLKNSTVTFQLVDPAAVSNVADIQESNGSEAE